VFHIALVLMLGLGGPQEYFIQTALICVGRFSVGERG